MTPKNTKQRHPRGCMAASDCSRILTARVERIAATIPGLSSRLKPVIAAARDGVVAPTPREARAYLIGALHALRMDDDDFFVCQDALDRPLMP